MTTSPTPPAGEPYCRQCGYVLTGLVDSSKCPECGMPIVEVLARRGEVREAGIRYTSPVRLFGLPLIHVALGPKHGERRGRARGIIAIGDIAVGGIAIGGFSRGVVALGGVALGLASVGGLSIGLLTAFGGLAIGGFVSGGCAVGGIAHGGGAVGIVAQGGGAFGLYARGGSASRFRSSSQTDAVFQRWAWLLGRGRRSPRPTLWAAGIPLAWAAVIGLLALVRYVGAARDAHPP